MSSTVSPTSLFPQLRTPWLISSTTTWPSTVVQTWPGWITIWVGVAGSSAMVQWSLPTQTTTSPASSRVGSSPSGQTHRWPRTTAVTDSGASSSSRIDHGASSRIRSRKAPRARGPSRSPASPSMRSNVDADVCNGQIQPWILSTERRLTSCHDHHDQRRGAHQRTLHQPSPDHRPDRQRPRPRAVAAALVAGLQAGTYFTWATGVMPGPRQGRRPHLRARHAADEHRDREPGLHRHVPGRARAGRRLDRCGRVARPPLGDRRDRARRGHPASSPSPATSRSTTPSTPPARSTRSRTWRPCAPTSSRSG